MIGVFKKFVPVTMIVAVVSGPIIVGETPVIKIVSA